MTPEAYSIINITHTNPPPLSDQLINVKSVCYGVRQGSVLGFPADPWPGVLFPHYFIYKEQIKGLEFISSVVFAFGICSCQLSISKELSLSGKQAKQSKYSWTSLYVLWFDVMESHNFNSIYSATTGILSPDILSGSAIICKSDWNEKHCLTNVSCSHKPSFLSDTN